MHSFALCTALYIEAIILISREAYSMQNQREIFQKATKNPDKIQS